MKSLARISVSLIAALLLVSCGGSSAPKNQIATPSGAINLSNEAIVLFNAFGTDGGDDRDMIKVFLQKEGTVENDYYIYSPKSGGGHVPSIHRLKPGRYVFLLMSDDILLKLQEPLPIFTFDPARDIPLTPIEVKAGDVIYAGNLLVEGLTRSPVRSRSDGLSRGVNFEILDRSDLARQALEKYRPELAPKMQTRLIEVLP